MDSQYQFPSRREPYFFSLQIPEPLVTRPPGTNSPAYIKNIIKVASHFAGNREKPHKRLCIFYALRSNACVLACLQLIPLEHKVPSPACFVTCRIFHVARDSPCLMPTESPPRRSMCGSCSSTGVDLLQTCRTWNPLVVQISGVLMVPKLHFRTA